VPTIVDELRTRAATFVGQVRGATPAVPADVPVLDGRFPALVPQAALDRARPHLPSGVNRGGHAFPAPGDSNTLVPPSLRGYGVTLPPVGFLGPRLVQVDQFTQALPSTAQALSTPAALRSVGLQRRGR
jgi:hypothetical protein